jgi:hypothetical protein
MAESIPKSKWNWRDVVVVDAKAMLLASLGIALVVFTLALTFVQLRQRSLYDLGNFRDFRVDPYIRKASELQALGKDKAIDSLMECCKIRDQDNKVIILCRMLFKQKGKEEFRRPMIGEPVFFGKTDYEDWPLEPIELVDGVPFLITFGYAIEGEPELSESYIRYCVQHGDWNDAKFEPKTEQEKQKALDKLLASPKWRKPLNDQEKTFLSAQIK